jgi:molybdopterin-binding protein
MNTIKARIKSLQTKDSLTIVTCTFYDEPLYMMALQLPQNLQKDSEVILGIKPTHVAVAKDFNIATSFLNQLRVSIVSVEVGELLSIVKGVSNGVIIEAVISTKAYYRLNLHVGDSAVMFLPASELSIIATN